MNSDPIHIPIDGILDLHTFQPSEIKSLISNYLEECQQRGILQVRIIHGKGTGALRKSVHSILRKLPIVHTYGLASIAEGGWGATIVQIFDKK